MIVISDTTPVISLLKIDSLHILREMYGEIVIPEAVYSELIANPAFPDEIAAVKKCPFLRREAVKNQFAVRILEMRPPSTKVKARPLFLLKV